MDNLGQERMKKCWQEENLPSPSYLQALKIRAGFLEEDISETVIPFLRRDDVPKPVIFVGVGTCGLVAGARKTMEEVTRFLDRHHLAADLIQVGCIGLCSAEPLLDVQLPGVDRVSFHNVTGDKVEKVLSDLFLHHKINAAHVLGQFDTPGLKKWPGVDFIDQHPFFAHQTRNVLKNCGLVNPLSLKEYIARGGYAAFLKTIDKYTPSEICDLVEKSGLRGRGGGGFPTGTKWKIAAQGRDQKILICNADEGDPGAFMNRALIEGDPYRLLEGITIAAYAIGASQAYIYIRAEYSLAGERLEHALREAYRYGLLGEDILDSGFNLYITLKRGAGAFICGEETALIHSLEGRRGMPRPKPSYPAEEGFFNKPTVVNNVETLANLPHIVEKGAAWFAQMGTENSKGTKVFSISGMVSRTGLIEVAMGTPIKKVIFDIGGGIAGGDEFKAVQIGGPSGGILPAQHLDAEIDYEKLKQVGAMMGSGGLVVMGQRTCMVDMAEFFMDFIQRESCGKCIPCREGTKRMREILGTITRGSGQEADSPAIALQGIESLRQLAETIHETSLCGLGQNATNPVLSTLRWFKDEYEAHIHERRCPAGVCGCQETK